MATYIVGGALLALTAAVIIKLYRDKKSGKSACACGGDCAHCHACRYSQRMAGARPAPPGARKISGTS